MILYWTVDAGDERLFVDGVHWSIDASVHRSVGPSVTFPQAVVAILTQPIHTRLFGKSLLLVACNVTK